MAELGRSDEIEPQLLQEIATSFASWSSLTRKQKRLLLRAYGAQIAVRRPSRAASRS